ncbi:MAG TPA: DM13 domain-containing protein [Thermoleophilaceae bacterium]|nr:DM13 domain-containing protein [Thermoleophilaceae bacterium]
MSIAHKLLAALAVIAVVAAGLWVSGGLITNDFTVAMVLTAAWMGLAAAGCLAIAWRRPALRVPVGVAYLLTAAVAGIYLGRSQFVDDEVDERVVMAAPAEAREPATKQAPRPRNRSLGSGAFRPVAHPARGTATIVRRARGGDVLTLTSFEVDNGPDLRVYLVKGPARDEAGVKDPIDLGALKGNKGSQQYGLPRGLRRDRYDTVVVWCRAFSVNFARAPLG